MIFTRSALKFPKISTAIRWIPLFWIAGIQGCLSNWWLQFPIAIGHLEIGGQYFIRDTTAWRFHLQNALRSKVKHSCTTWARAGLDKTSTGCSSAYSKKKSRAFARPFCFRCFRPAARPSSLR
jgi:hypothetical protein